MATRAEQHRPKHWKPAEKNYNPEHDLYRTAAWVKTRNAVVKRDGGRCRLLECSTPNQGRNGRLIVHHMRGRQGSFALDEQHLVTVCPACHARIHAKDYSR